jgi:hypothetical protein
MRLKIDIFPKNNFKSCWAQLPNWEQKWAHGDSATVLGIKMDADKREIQIFAIIWFCMNRKILNNSKILIKFK